jgi:hypothetical protein
MTDITKIPLFVFREMWLESEISDEAYIAESKRRDETIESLRSRAEKAEAELLTMTRKFNGAVGLKDQQRMRAEIAEATCEKLATALEDISKAGYGFQSIMEEHKDGSKSFFKAAFDYYRNQTVWRQHTARTALSEYRKEASNAD